MNNNMNYDPMTGIPIQNNNQNIDNINNILTEPISNQTMQQNTSIAIDPIQQSNTIINEPINQQIEYINTNIPPHIAPTVEQNEQQFINTIQNTNTEKKEVKKDGANYIFVIILFIIIIASIYFLFPMLLKYI